MRRREEDDRHQHQRVVVPLADTHQKRDCRPPPEQVNSRTTAFRRPTLPVLVLTRTGMGTTWRQQKQWIFLESKLQTMQGRRRLLYCNQWQPRSHRRSRDRIIHPHKNLPSSYSQEFRNRNSRMQLARN